MSRSHHRNLGYLIWWIPSLGCASTDTTRLSALEQGEPALSPAEANSFAAEPSGPAVDPAPSPASVEPDHSPPITSPAPGPSPPIEDAADPITPEGELPPADAPELNGTSHPIGFISFGRDSSGNLGAPELFVARADGRDVVQVTSGSLGYIHQQWSPDGRTFAAMAMMPSGYFDIVLVSLRDGSVINLTADTTGADDWFPTWSPDGQRIIYLAGEPGGLRRLMVMSRFGGQRRPVLPVSDRGHWGGSWSWQDATQLAFAADADGSSLQDLFLVNPDAPGEPRNLTRGRLISPDRPYWSPDGKRLTFIAFLELERENRRVYVLNLETDELVRASSHDRTEEVPSWSPDGLSLLMTRDTTRDGELWLVPLDPLGTAVNFSNRPSTFDGFGTWYVPPRAVLP